MPGSQSRNDQAGEPGTQPEHDRQHDRLGQQPDTDAGRGEDDGRRRDRGPATARRISAGEAACLPAAGTGCRSGSGRCGSMLARLRR